MATATEIALVRQYINEPNNEQGWTDVRIGEIADAATNLKNAAGDIWTIKAATYIGLVDVSESGSSRKLSDLHKQAKDMADYYYKLGGAQDIVDSGTGAPIVARIVRT